MTDRIYTIGELSKMSGVSVRRLRFYSDKALLPPTARAASGYRMYSEADLARLDLIVALRNAGVSLGEIRKILSRRLALADVLALRLKTLEAEIVSKRRVAAALRSVLKLSEPTPQDLRRLWTVTHLSQLEFRTAVERFFDEAAEGTKIDPSWRQKMIDISTPELPDDPTPEQLDAWTELAALLSDKDYIQEVRASMSKMWTQEFDAFAYAEASNQTFDQVRAAIKEGHAPQSGIGKAIARDWLEASATAMKREPNASFLDWHLDQYRRYHSRAVRYQELMTILQGENATSAAGSEWRWIITAMEHHL
ncbi:MerR family transcriptional regulator [Hyphomicrobium sp.]|uniref:MerR family transcriptional regulator n=1 Tax=Hyphomicrobium sp. TaxID=82 RepID=UPI002E33E9FE|nr:MerR family transcriptional regulator [Hyphomicrobium sp.]HEX2840346.1 MerR family transcriptional regulator [Hyphomicrobium sp.]